MQAFSRAIGEASGQATNALPGSLIEAIDLAIRRAGVAKTDIGRIAVSTGPGGYTSVRVGVATAASIAATLGAMCVAVPTVEVVARNIGWSRQGTPGRIAIALAGKRESAWVVFVEPPQKLDHPPHFAWDCVLEGAVCDATHLSAVHARTPFDALVADAHLPEAIGAWARSAGVRVEAPVFSAVACFEASLTHDAVEPSALLPVYTREPEAASKWRALHSDAGQDAPATSIERK